MFEFTPAEFVAIALSLKVAAVAALVDLPFGIAIGWLLARKRFLGKSLLDALVHLPLVLPPVVVGYALLVTLGNQGAVGRFLAAHGLGVAFHWTGAALASAVMGFPLMVRAIRLRWNPSTAASSRPRRRSAPARSACSSASPCR